MRDIRLSMSAPTTWRGKKETPKEEETKEEEQANLPPWMQKKQDEESSVPPWMQKKVKEETKDGEESKPPQKWRWKQNQQKKEEETKEEEEEEEEEEVPNSPTQYGSSKFESRMDQLIQETDSTTKEESSKDASGPVVPYPNLFEISDEKPPSSPTPQFNFSGLAADAEEKEEVVEEEIIVEDEVVSEEILEEEIIFEEVDDDIKEEVIVDDNDEGRPPELTEEIVPEEGVEMELVQDQNMEQGEEEEVEEVEEGESSDSSVETPPLPENVQSGELNQDESAYDEELEFDASATTPDEPSEILEDDVEHALGDYIANVSVPHQTREVPMIPAKEPSENDLNPESIAALVANVKSQLDRPPVQPDDDDTVKAGGANRSSKERFGASWVLFVMILGCLTVAAVIAVPVALTQLKSEDNPSFVVTRSPTSPTVAPSLSPSSSTSDPVPGTLSPTQSFFTAPMPEAQPTEAPTDAPTSSPTLPGAPDNDICARL